MRMKTYTLIAGSVVIAVLIGVVFWMVTARVATAPEGTVCAADVQICSDGSYVSRTGPACEFAACPGAFVSNAVSAQAGIGQTVTGLGVSITPLAVVEDSRCPKDVQCIQAGTVRVSARVVSGLGISTSELTLGQALTTEAETVTLTAVAPQKISTVTTKASDYVFTFEIAKRSSAPASSGVQGTITLGPTCPVERTPPDPACADKPYSTTVTARAVGSNAVVATTKSATDGSFKIDLAPGAYTLTAQGGVVMPTCVAVTVSVAPGLYALANVSCDTGIR